MEEGESEQRETEIEEGERETERETVMEGGGEWERQTVTEMKEKYGETEKDEGRDWGGGGGAAAVHVMNKATNPKEWFKLNTYPMRILRMPLNSCGENAMSLPMAMISSCCRTACRRS